MNPYQYNCKLLVYNIIILIKHYIQLGLLNIKEGIGKCRRTLHLLGIRSSKTADYLEFKMFGLQFLLNSTNSFKIRNKIMFCKLS
jgi:hypothetical protein